MKTIKVFFKIIGNILVMIVLAVVLILSVAKISNVLTIENSLTNIEKDQLWVGVIHEKNQYGNKKCDTIKILDVSDGYSRVKIKNDTLVLKNEMIKYKRNLIK